MELVSTMEISGEEREIADAVARGQIDGINSNLSSEISRAKETEEVLKSRIDTIASLQEGSTTGDAELQDIRVKADGSTATSAGNAVREQVSELKGDLVQITERLNLFNKHNYNIAKSNTEYFYIAGSGDIDTASLTSGNPRMIYINIKPNTIYTVKKSTSTCMRVGTYAQVPTTKQHATSYAVHSSASSDKLTVVSGSNDLYLGVHLFSDSDVSSLKTIDVNIADLIIAEGTEIHTSDISAVDIVARNQNKECILNLKNYAKGDGFTDDTVAINSALQDAQGKILYVPSGTYLFSGTLTIKSGTHIIGCGKESLFKLANVFDLTDYSWRPALGDKYNYRYPMIRTEENSYGCIIDNISIEGQKNAFKDENEDGLCIVGSNHIVRNVIVTDVNYFPSQFSGRNCITPCYGINIIDSDTVTVENCSVDKCGYEGIGTERASNITVINCKCGICNQTGLQVHASSKAVRFINCEVTMTERASITFDADTDAEMEDIIVDGCSCGKGVVFVAGGEKNITLSNNRFRGGISCNNGTYRDKIKIVNNTIGGRVDVYADNSIYTNNAVNENTGYYYIIARGNNCIVANNIGTGTVKDVTEITH